AQGLAVVQRVDGGMAVVQHIAVGAVRIGGKGAVLCCGAALPAIEGDGPVESAVVGERVTADLTAAAGRGDAVGFTLRQRIGVGNQDFKGVDSGLAQVVDYAELDGIADCEVAGAVILGTVDRVVVVDLPGAGIVAGDCH